MLGMDRYPSRSQTDNVSRTWMNTTGPCIRLHTPDDSLRWTVRVNMPGLGEWLAGAG